MTQEPRTKVWADVGGTFTDCFVTVPGETRKFTKVLSNAVVKSAVDAGSQRDRIIATQLPPVPDEFWKGFSLSFSGSSFPAGGGGTREVVAFDSTNQSLQLDRPLDDAPVAGDTFELQSPVSAPILATRILLGIPLDHPLPPTDVRLGTTRGTNALLTRTGAETALVATAGFGDLLEIGEQDRPELFALNVVKRLPLASRSIEIPERIAADGSIVQALDTEVARQRLQSLQREGIQSIAISLLNAYKNPNHEVALAAIARDVGFTEISVSHQIARVIKYVARSETTVLDAYLNPIIGAYVDRVWQQFGGPKACSLQMMTSGGDLVAADSFRGKDSILSGPAGGVVALAKIADAHGAGEAIGLDMGGTSTDVARYDGRFARQYEAFKAGVRILTPMMAIETVAAGGGSICQFDGQRLLVGPESAGANPGPACYRRGGPLAVTDLNVLVGRVDTSRFPFELDPGDSRMRTKEIIDRMRAAGLAMESVEALALGFREIANHHMAEAVRSVTTAEGADPRNMTLVGFGGAAGAHLCAVAEILGIHQILDHPQSSMLSALGIGLASAGTSRSRGVYRPLSDVTDAQLATLRNEISAEAMSALSDSIDAVSGVEVLASVELRYAGTETPIELDWGDPSDWIDRHAERHQQLYGYQRGGHALELVSVRAAASQGGGGPEELAGGGLEAGVEVGGMQLPSLENRATNENVSGIGQPSLENRATSDVALAALPSKCVWFESGPVETRCYDRDRLLFGATIKGPAIVVADFHSLVVDPGWTATVKCDGTISLCKQPSPAAIAADPSIGRVKGNAPSPWEGRPPKGRGGDAPDPVLLEVLACRFQGIATQMGLVLQRTAISVNVKQRRDYSCAIFRGDGSLVANAPHVPVHLGAMGHTVRAIAAKFPKMFPGDCYLSNDPFGGGSHLPDVTTVTPVFVPSGIGTQPDFFVASRAHHAEIGGITPGSMPPAATCLAEEGVLIRALPLIRDGQSNESEIRGLLSGSPYPSRNPDENLADIFAAQAAGWRGAEDLIALSDRYGGKDVVDAYMGHLQDVAALAVADRIESLPDRPLAFVDYLDDGSPVAVQIVREGKRLEIDFAGTAPVHPRGFNATPAIVTAAVMYVLRVVSDHPIPLNEGVLRQVDLKIPEGLLNPPRYDDPRRCAAVVAGNVETSNRVVDALMGALGVAAASQGTMNNLLFGDDSFGYYETICGGTGATIDADGASAVHSHMTNTRITDPEILEQRYPVRLHRFAIRRGSGGEGRHRGGDGVIREIEFMRSLTLSMLTSRRGGYPPYAVGDAQPGAIGENWLLRADGTRTRLESTCRVEVEKGDRVVIQTPGGGGFS